MVEVKTLNMQNLCIENIEGEEWKDINEYEGVYKISNYGRVKSIEKTYNNYILKREITIPELIMKTNLICGYPMLHLSKNKIKKLFSIHRLLGIHFLPNPNNYPCINHKNSNRSDNRLCNLEWCTYSYNSEHAFRIGGRTQKKGKDDELSKPFIAKHINTNEEITFYSQREAAKVLNTFQASIYKALHKQKVHKNYKFDFITK